MATAIDSALDSALDASFTVFGEAVTVDGVAATGIVTGSGLNDMFVSGGKAESLGKSLTLRKSDFATKPTADALCVVRGITLQIISVEDRLRHWKLDLGNQDGRGN